MVKFFQRNIHQKKDALFILLFSLVILILLNVVSQYGYFRWDLTAEKKYSLTPPTKQLLKKLENTVHIKVYLEGDMPAGFKRLRQSTRDLLSEFRSYGGKKIDFQFVDPVNGKSKEEQKILVEELIQKGLSPANVQTGNANESKLTMLFPCAVVSIGDKEFPVQLLDNQIGYSQEEILNNSVISLEYKFSNAIQKLTQYRPFRICFLKGHGESEGLKIADLQQALVKNNYEVQTLDLTKTFEIYNQFDLAIIAKPSIAFDEKDKYKIDQFLMKGGKLLWLIDATTAEMDSLQLMGGVQNVTDKNLNLDDMLFKYGARINTDLIQDINLCNQIPLVVGSMGNAPQTEMFPWYYFPLVTSDNNHAIVKNLDPVATKFVSSIDTIRVPNISKTILLKTSDLSKAILTPLRVHFGILQQKPNPEYYKQPKLPVAVLLEGKFTSLYKNRLAQDFLNMGDSLHQLKFVDQSPESKMIVIADGDVIENEISNKGVPYPLGYYGFTRQTFANKDFLLNSIQYLVDNSGLLETRNKEIKLRLLNNIRIQKEKLKWQLLNIALPILFVVIFGYFFQNYRRKKYTT